MKRGGTLSKFGIAGLQLDLQYADNRDRLEREIDSACRRFPWLNMVIIGELAMYGPNTINAQALPSDTEKRMCAAAQRNNIWLLPGTMFEKHDGKVFNTAPVINPSGEVIARYRKMYPFLPYESEVTAGSEFVTFDIPDVGRFGVSICYDMWFPETIRTLAWMGAEVILHPSMTNTIDRDAELAIARANAATNQCYFIDINVTGDLGLGRSAIYGPGGEVIHVAGSGREIIAVELDLETVRSARQRGWLGLTQPLKSFRDSKIEFPQYPLPSRSSTYFDSLGPLTMPPSFTRKGRK